MPRRRYDVVWIQWVLNYLTDADLLAFLQRCARALRDPARDLVFVKENMLASSADDDASFNFDQSDSSVTRSEAHFRRIFAAAGLRVVGYDQQKSFPKDMLPVRMFALRPADPAAVEQQCRELDAAEGAASNAAAEAEPTEVDADEANDNDQAAASNEEADE